MTAPRIKEFVEVSKANKHRLPANIFVTDEADPEKAIPAMLDAIMNKQAVAAVWLHDYWAKERALFRELEKRGPIDVHAMKHQGGEKKLSMVFNCRALLTRRQLKARIRRRKKTLEKIVLRHFDPAFREYMIQGGQGRDFFDVHKSEQLHVDQSKYFALSFIGAVSGPGTWFVSTEDTQYYRDYYKAGEHDAGEMTRGYCANDNPVLYGVPEGAVLLMPSGDRGPNGGRDLLHTTPFALKTPTHEFKEGDKRIFERFTISGPDYRSALRRPKP